MVVLGPIVPDEQHPHPPSTYLNTTSSDEQAPAISLQDHVQENGVTSSDDPLVVRKDVLK
jgi:hypothetical protein